MRPQTTSEAGAGARRLDVRSADRTPLAVWVEGQGPAVVPVHGSLCDHTHFGPWWPSCGRV